MLVVSYVATHPDRVEKLVFSSPGNLDPQAPPAQPQARLDTAERLRLYGLLIPPRALLTYALAQVNPAAAHAFAGDREVDARQDRLYAAALPGLHCEPPQEVHGLGFNSNQVLQAMRQDVRPAVRGSGIPALVIKGQCDYLDWQSAMGYLDLFSTSTLVYLRGAGHEAYLDRPEQYAAAVQAFLAGRTVPGRCRTLACRPRTSSRSADQRRRTAAVGCNYTCRPCPGGPLVGSPLCDSSLAGSSLAGS